MRGRCFILRCRGSADGSDATRFHGALRTKINSISYLKANTVEVLEQLRHSREPLIIYSAWQGKAVLQDMASFEETQQTLAMLKILAIGNQELGSGQIRPVAEVVARLRAKMVQD